MYSHSDLVFQKQGRREKRVIGNEWTFWEYAFFGVVVFFVGALNLVMDHWIVVLTLAAICYVAWGRSKPMKFILLAVVLAVLLSVAGCAQMFACTTEASFEVTMSPEGKTLSRKVTYSSCKEQIGLDAQFAEDGTPKRVQVDKAGTQESVIAATAAVQLKMLDMISQLMAAKPPVK